MINHGIVNRGQILVRFLWFVLILSSPLFGCTSGESGQVRNVGPAELQIPSDSTQNINILDMATVAPDSWRAIPPSSSMRLAQFAISDEGLGKVIVFFFGAGQGGGAQANIARWVGQFRPVNGKPVQAMVTNMKTFGGFLVTWVEIQGDYARGVGVGPIGDYKSDQMLIAAIIQTSRGNLNVQFYGDKGTVLEHRNEFAQFVLALQKRSI